MKRHHAVKAKRIANSLTLSREESRNAPRAEYLPDILARAPSSESKILANINVKPAILKYPLKKKKAPGPTDDVVKILKDTGTDVVVNYLPVGSEEATKWYVEQILAAKVGMVNAIPVFIATSSYWTKRFKDAGQPIIGDDIKSQVGATITHRVLTQLFLDRGVEIEKTYQLNVGGNTDFLNMLERERLVSKKVSKTQAVTSLLPFKMPEENIHIGPSDHIPWLKDRKWCYIKMEGKTFGNVPLHLELKLEVWDSPNSAGVIIDAVRCIKLAKDHNISGPLTEPSSYFMKSPPKQYPDSICKNKTEDFIKKYPGKFKETTTKKKK